MSSEDFLWVEKYRPNCIEDCILPDKVKTEIRKAIDQGSIGNMLFAGGAGTGKTTLAKAISSELGADLLYLNASNENGVDTIRNKVTQFASTVSLDGNLKIILLDEADGLTAAGNGGGAQGILRATIEEFHKSTRFILTCNFKNKLIEPLHSRLQVYDFKIPNEDKPVVMAAFFKRVKNILDIEGVKYDQKALASLVQKYFPDFRKTLNELQRYSVSGMIDSGILIDQNTSFEELVSHMKNKKFGEIRKWVARNTDLEPSAIFRYFYDNLSNIVQPQNMPEIILLSAQYQDMSSRVVDQEINTMAYLVEILSAAVWK